MACLHESQGKALLAHKGIPVPVGRVVSTPEEVRDVSIEIDGPVVLEVQVWATGRAGMGGCARELDRPPTGATEGDHRGTFCSIQMIDGTSEGDVVGLPMSADVVIIEREQGIRRGRVARLQEVGAYVAETFGDLPPVTKQVLVEIGVL